MKIDYYKVLGVARDASANDIKLAFRKLALECHPDRHVQSSISSREAAGLRFRQVSEAYEVLGDNLKRIAYNKGKHYAGTQGTGPSRRYEGPPRRRYYRRTYQGYTTYGSAQARYATDRGAGVRWRPEPEFSSAERKEKLMNTIFFGFALPMFLFADYLEAAFWPQSHPSLGFDEELRPEKPKSMKCKKKVKTEPVQTSKVEQTPLTKCIRDSQNQGCKSLLENSSVGYSYVVGQGLGRLQSAANLAQNLPETVPQYPGPQNLRSLLTMECRLSDLQLEGIHSWLRQKTGIPVNR